MRAHLEAVGALLQPRRFYLGDVDGTPQYPYFVIWASVGALEDISQDGRQDAINDTFGVTGSAATYGDVMDLQRVARSKLIGTRLNVPGWSTAELRLVDSQPVQVDRDVRMPNGRFPSFGVDLYRLISEPI